MNKVLAQWLPAMGMAVVVGGYVAVQASFFTPACREPDTAGYLTMAEHLAYGRPLAQHDDPFRNQNHVWVENERGDVVPKYAPGLPVAMAIGYRLFGERGAFWVSPLAGVLTLVGAGFLFRLWMSPGMAVLAVLALASNPMFLVYTNYPLAHAVDICLVTWGMFFLWKWFREPSVGVALGAGLSLGAAPAVRPANVLLALVVLAALLGVIFRKFAAPSSSGERSRGTGPDVADVGGTDPGATGAEGQTLVPWGQALILVLAYAVFPMLHMAYNTALFGSPVTTGYALSNEQWAFSLPRLMENMGGVLQLLGGEAFPVYFGLGLAGILFWRSMTETWMFLAWIVPITLLYSSYYWMTSRLGMACARFLFCTFPALIGAAFALLDRCASFRPRGRWLVGGLCVSVMVFQLGRAGEALRTTVATRELKQQQQAGEIAGTMLTDGAVIFCRQPVCVYIGQGKGFTVYDLEAFDYARTQQRWKWQARSPWTPRGQETRKTRVEAFYEENSSRLPELKRDKIRSALSAGRQVAFLIEEKGRRGEAAALGSGFTFTPLTVWDMEGSHKEWRDQRWQDSPKTNTWAIYDVREAAAD